MNKLSAQQSYDQDQSPPHRTLSQQHLLLNQSQKSRYSYMNHHQNSMIVGGTSTNQFKDQHNAKHMSSSSSLLKSQQLQNEAAGPQQQTNGGFFKETSTVIQPSGDFLAFYGAQNDSSYSSYGSSSEEDEKLEIKVREVNDKLKISYNKKSLNIVKRMVSRNKRRFVQEGFDLDLSYVTDNLIAMGYPGVGLESFYRNSMEDVQRFFTQKHSKRYKIYNLCKERSYPDSCFEKANQNFIFEDHNPPPFELIDAFCQDLDKFMSENPDNVAAVHCKAGKGRTGVMICCYLIYSRQFKTAKEALVFYGKIRTSNGKGVTIPSQIRYVYYYEEFLKFKRREYPKKIISMPRRVVKIYKIRMISIPQIQNGGIDMTFRFKFKDQVIYDFKQEGKTKFLQDLSYYDFKIKSNTLLVYDDVKVEFFHKNKLTLKKVFHIWFNTSFIDKSGTIYIDKPMIDKAWKDKKCRKFDQNFRIEIYTSNIINYEMELIESEKGVLFELPIERFSDDQRRLLELAEKLPKLQRKLSL